MKKQNLFRIMKNAATPILTRCLIVILMITAISTDSRSQCTTMPGTAILATGIVNWNFPTTRIKNILVPNGCTLNITSAQYMSPGITITINPGGVVNLNSGGSLQACNVTWGGFRIMGNATLSQTSANQGTLNINGSGTIKNATLAVDVDPGGICVTNGGWFIDNKEAVNMDAYSIATPPSVTNNASKFYGTNFLWTALFPGTTSFTQHVKLDRVYNIHFGGCIFNNTYGSSSTNPSIRGKGIVATEASLFCHRQNPATINGCKAYNGTKTKFTNLLAGVDARSVNTSTPNRSSRIWQCEFLNNDHDIFIDKEQEFRIDQNTFTYYEPNALFFAGQTSFIKINQLMSGTYPTTGFNYSIYHNDFNGYNSIILDFLLANETYNGLSVYKNNFVNSYPNNSCLAYGVKGSGNNIGASFTCNNYQGFYDRVLFFSGTNPTSFGSASMTAANTFPGCSNILTAILFMMGTSSTYYYGTGAGENPTGCNVGAFTLVNLTLPGQQNACADYICTVPPRMAAAENQQQLKVTAMPNPASDQITFELSNDVDAGQLIIHELSGKVVSVTPISNQNTIHANISNLESGIYFYEMISETGERITGKFIKE